MLRAAENDCRWEEPIHGQTRYVEKGAGDISFGSDGRATEGDMLTVLDTATNEMDFVSVKDVKLDHVEKAEDYANTFRQKLQEINSEGYRVAAQQQPKTGTDNQSMAGEKIKKPNAPYKAGDEITLEDTNSEGEKIGELKFKVLGYDEESKTYILKGENGSPVLVPEKYIEEHLVTPKVSSGEKPAENGENAQPKGRRRVVNLLGQLDKANGVKDKLNVIYRIKFNVKNGVVITPEEQAKVNQIENELKEQGYEIGDVLGKEIHDGDNIIVNSSELVEKGDPLYDKLEDGQSIVKRVIKPKISKDGKLYQAAEVVQAFRADSSVSEELYESKKTLEGLLKINNPNDMVKEFIEKTKAKIAELEKQKAEELSAEKNENGTHTYSLSEKKTSKGDTFYQDEKGNINMAEIPAEVFDSIGYTKAPFRLTESMVKHILTRHGKELGISTPDEAIHFVRDVMANFDHVRLGNDGALVFSIENGRKKTGKRAITIFISEDGGDFYGLKTSGFENMRGLEKRPLLWERGVKKESSSTATATANVAANESQLSGEQSGNASNQSIGLNGKDSKSSANGKGKEQKLTYMDGSEIETDKKGNAVYEKTSVENTVADLFGRLQLETDEASDFVAAKRKKAEDTLKKLEGKKPKMGDDISKYQKEKKKWQEDMEAAKKSAEHWDGVAKEIDRITTPDDAKNWQKELSGEAAYEAYEKGKGDGSEVPTAEDMAAEFISDAKITPESFKSETGLGNEEMRKFVGMINKGGKSIERIAEDLVEHDNNEYGGQVYHGDTNEARNAIISALTSAKSKGDLKKRMSGNEKEFTEQWEKDRDEAYMEKYHMTYEEYVKASEQEIPEMLRKAAESDAAFEDMMNTIRLQIKTQAQRKAAEDAYNWAAKHRPSERKQYAIVDMDKPQEIPQYFEKKDFANKEKGYFNKLGWGNYKLFDLDKTFEDNVKSLTGKFPEEFDTRPDDVKANEAVAEAKRRETVLRDTVVDILRKHGMDVSMDVKEGQRVLDEENERVRMMGSRVKKRMAEIGAHYDGKELGAEEQAVTDVFGGKKDRASFNLETKNGTVTIEMRQGNENNAGAKHSIFRHYGTGTGFFTAEEVSLIPEIVKNGERTANDKNAVYTKTINGVQYKVVTDIKGKKEVFHDFYTNRKADTSKSQNTLLSARTDEASANSDAKVQKENVSAKGNDEKPRFFRTADGEAYGFTVGGKIYIDPRIANSETPIHEYAHLWASALKKGNPKEWKNVVELMKNSRLWDFVTEDYPELKTDDAIADEVIATYSGRKGAERLRQMAEEVPAGKAFDKAQALGAIHKIKRALDKFWKGVADMLHIHYTTAEEVADRVMKDLLDGVDPRKTMKEAVEANPVEGMKKAADAWNEGRKVRLQKKEEQRESDVKDVAREYGVNAEDVKKYAEGMATGNLALATQGFNEIRRAKRLEHHAENPFSSKLSDFVKAFKPIKKSLYEKFGNVDELRQEYVRRAEEERGMMEAARKRAEEEEAKRMQHQEELSTLTEDEIDKRYADAIEKGDEQTAREMLDEAARRKGYGDTDSEYQGVGAWVAPSNPGYESDEARRADVEDNAPDVNLEDMALGYNLQPDDYFDHPERYSQNTPHGLESTRAIRTALEALKRGDKDVKVKVYRAVPTSVKEGSLRNGDWVTPSRKYAEMHGNSRLEGKFRIIEDEVPAKDLWWDGNDANEFGYDDGKTYKYKNAKNNRKLNDLVTRDDKGNVIPPSKRFNSRKSDVRYRINLGETFSNDKDHFDAVRDRAIKEKGIVMPNLKKESVKVVKVENEPFGDNIEESLANARQWAKDHIATTKDSELPTMKDGTPYTISNGAIAKYLSQSAVKKSDNLEVHLSALRKLPEIIHESIEAEIHPDYKKGEDGTRTAENGYGENILVHRLYGAINIDGKIYRVKTTMHEFRGGEENKPHSYEVTKIELLEGSEKANESDNLHLSSANNNSKNELPDTPGTAVNPDSSPSDMTPNNSISTAKLLEGVEKSYDKGKKLLDESKDLTDGETYFRVDKENSQNNSSSMTSPVNKAVERLTKIAENTGKKLGVKVNAVQSVEDITDPNVRKDIEAGKPVQGWYDPKTGEVHLYMPNIHCSRDAVKTVWHETVGHKGMRGLLGDKFKDYMRGLWYDLDNPINKELREYVRDRMAKEPMSMYDAIEEYLADAAENGKGEPGFWMNIRNRVADALREIGYRIQPNVKDVKYMLWLAKNVQKHPNDAVWKMRAEAVKWRIEHEKSESVVERDGMMYDNDGKSHDLLDLGKRQFDDATDGHVHYKTAPIAASKIAEYNKRLSTKWYAFRESTIDEMQALQEAMKVISGVKNVYEDIPSAFNPLQAHNRMGSVVQMKCEEFDRAYGEPLDEVFKQVVSAMPGKDSTEQTRNANLYFIKKHGLERNRTFFVRDKIKETKSDTLAIDWQAKKDSLGDELRNGKIDLKEYYSQMDEWIRKNVDANYNASEHDYSGMHGIQEIVDADGNIDATKPYC